MTDAGSDRHRDLAAVEEVIIERALGDTGTHDDLVDGRRIDPPVGKQLRCRLDQNEAHPLAARRGKIIGFLGGGRGRHGSGEAPVETI